VSSHLQIAFLAGTTVLLSWLVGWADARDANSVDANATPAATSAPAVEAAETVDVDVKLPTPPGETSIQEMIRRLNAAGAGAGLADTAQPIPSGSDAASDSDPGSKAKPEDVEPDAAKPANGSDDPNATPAELLDQMKRIAPDSDASSSKGKTPRRRKQIDLQTLPEDTVKNPIQLADVLYLGGHWKAAATFYVMVVEGDGKKYPKNDKVWALYQLGNCQRRYDPTEAKVTYKRLIEEYPDSPWVAASQVQQRLLTWKLSSKPKQLVEKHRNTGMAEVNDKSDAETKGAR
jgi:hypothetical protein